MEFDLIIKYLAGETDRDEKKFLEDWIQKSNKNKEEFDEIKMVWDQIDLARSYSSEKINSAWLSLSALINDNKNRISLFNRTIFLKIAAIFIVTISLVIALYSTSHFHRYISAKGKKEIVLPDQSHVVLNKSSKIIYTSWFFGERKVKLNGEAFFDVTHMEDKAFIVSSGKTEISVLGTSFYVLSNNDQGITDIKVTSGQVKVKGFMSAGNDETLILTKGECAKVNYQDHTMNKYLKYDTNVIAWNTGKLIFKAVRLEEVFKILNNTYGISVQSKNQIINDLRFTGTFHNTPVNDIVETISRTFEIHATIDKENQEILFF